MQPPVPTQKIYSAPRLGPVTHAYSPFKLWQMIAPGTTHVLVKHLDLLENIVPILIAQAKGAQIIVMVQQVKMSYWRFILIRCAAWYLRSVGATVFSVTSSGKNALKDLLPNITYIPACINPKRFTLATMHHQDSNTLRVLTIGKYIQRKNFATLIDAVRMIRFSQPNLSIHLTLVGPPTDKAVYDGIHRLVSASPLLCDIVTIHASIPPDQISSILADHNLFILPATSEPLGYAVLEAMAAGLPVITTAEVGSASYIENDKNGFVVPDARQETLMNAIMSFVTPKQTPDMEKLRQFGRHSRSLVERLHTPDATIQSVINILS